MEERIVQADPVGDPQGYQREMLTLLGGRAPVDVLAATALAIGERAKGVSEELLTRRPEPKEWSVAEVLGHLWDAEIAYSFRARLMLAQDSPRLIGYDQDAWAALARPAFAELLDAFAALRTANPRPDPTDARDPVGSPRLARGAGSHQLLPHDADCRPATIART